MQHLGPLVIRRHNGDTSLTISKHAALEGYSALSFGVFEIVVALLFFLFIKNWFTPNLGLPNGYTMATGMYLCVVGLAVFGTLPTWLTGLTWFASAYMSVGILYALINPAPLKGKLLYYQAAFMGTFYLIMILATYFHF